MSKVILTQEQADIIEITSLDKLGEWFYKDARNDTRMYKLFCDFSIEKLAKAKLIGYEVEPEFKVGDWATHKLSGDVGIVKKANAESVHADNGMGGWINDFRHAIPEEIAEEKERRWWAKHGREPWELKEFDELRDKRNDYRYTVSEDINKTNVGLIDTYINYKYFTPIKIKENFLVVCFAESRLDVKDDE